MRLLDFLVHCMPFQVLVVLLQLHATCGILAVLQQQHMYEGAGLARVPVDSSGCQSYLLRGISGWGCAFTSCLSAFERDYAPNTLLFGHAGDLTGGVLTDLNN